MATVLPPLPRGVGAYVRAFDLTSIAVTRDGRLIVSRNPAGATAAWWCPAREASRVARHARKDSGDIPAAARALGVPVTVHDVAVQRAAASVARIDEALAEAQRSGLLGCFNAEYKRRRAAANAIGQGFMNYATARGRLRRAVAGIIAAGGGRDLDIAAIRGVFE